MKAALTTGHDAIWLRALGAVKFCKAMLLTACGIGILRLVNTNFGEQMGQIADLLRYSTISHIIAAIFDKASLLSDRRLEQLALGAFVYAATELIEGYGLIRRQVWAEYMTLGFTVAFLPIEIFEIAKELSWVKIAIAIGNALIAWYLVWHIRRKREVRLRRGYASA